MNSGLLNLTGVGMLPATTPGLPGQAPTVYGTPSKSLSEARHPMKLFSSVVPVGLTIGAGKQPWLSVGLGPFGSLSPCAGLQLKLESILVQFSKWPISSEKATLYECAAHRTRVSGDDVLYIGWKA
jgi:hypothetical protein